MVDPKTQINDTIRMYEMMIEDLMDKIEALEDEKERVKNDLETHIGFFEKTI